MFTKGFTLIELMVVIVIIAILAAIAIPKLFGMSAKARAAEVGPAVGSWSKLEQVYKSELSSLGKWVSIGYTAPTSNTFQYDEPPLDVDSARWSAMVFGKDLNASCPAGSYWKAAFGASAETPVAYPPEVVSCGELTPNFVNLK